MPESFSNKVAEPCNFIKEETLSQIFLCNFIKQESLLQVFSCEICEISENTFSNRAPPVAASEVMLLVRAFLLTHLFRTQPFSIPWKNEKTVRFSDVFRRQRKGALGTKGKNILNVTTLHITHTKVIKLNLKTNLTWGLVW